MYHHSIHRESHLDVALLPSTFGMIFITLAFSATLGISAKSQKNQTKRLWVIILCTCIGSELLHAYFFSWNLGMAFLSSFWWDFHHI
jgi:hypothetical protein